MIVWKIDSLAAQITSGEIERRRADSKVVVKARWRVIASEKDESASVTGEQEFVYDPTVDFTPYDQLTEIKVLEWVHSAMGAQRQAFEDMAMQRLIQQRSAPVVLSPPWFVATPSITNTNSDIIQGNDTVIS